MKLSLMKEGHAAVGAVSLIVLALLSNECSGNAVPVSQPSRPLPGHIVESNFKLSFFPDFLPCDLSQNIYIKLTKLTISSVTTEMDGLKVYSYARATGVARGSRTINSSVSGSRRTRRRELSKGCEYVDLHLIAVVLLLFILRLLEVL